MLDFEQPENSDVSSIRKMYFQDISQYPLMTEEDEKTYGLMLKNPQDKKLLVFNSLDNCDIPILNVELLFYSLCGKECYQEIINDLLVFYNKLYNNNDKEVDMLVKYKREANKLGRALDNNDLERVFHIKCDSEIDFLSEKDLFKEIKEFMNYKMAVWKLEQELGRQLSDQEIAEKLQMPIELVCEYKMYMYDDIRLDSPIGESDDGVTLQDIIQSDVDVEELVLNDILEEDIEVLFETLTDREILVIKMMFGLGEYKGQKHTLETVGKKLSLTRQRVNQIKTKALYKIKRYAKIHPKQGAMREYMS